MTDALTRLKSEVAALKRNRRHGRVRPHKLVMLLAVMDLAEENLLSGNRVPFDEALISRFEQNFTRFCRADDLCQPAPPFFHLRSSPFWNHRIKPGQDEVYASLSTSGGGSKWISGTIDYAYLSDHAYAVLRSPTQRRELRRFVEAILDSEDVTHA